MELVDYTDADLPLSLALESDPRVMAELGGPRPEAAIAAVHRSRVAPMPDGGLWLKVLLDDFETAAGAVGVWRSSWEGDAIWEAGWMLLPDHQGRGIASRAVAMLIERLRAAGSFDRVHAFPGVSNGPSNGICRKFGFDLLGEAEIEFADRPLRCNHWVLALDG